MKTLIIVGILVVLLVAALSIRLSFPLAIDVGNKGNMHGLAQNPYTTQMIEQQDVQTITMQISTHRMPPDPVGKTYVGICEDVRANTCYMVLPDCTDWNIIAIDATLNYDGGSVRINDLYFPDGKTRTVELICDRINQPRPYLMLYGYLYGYEAWAEVSGSFTISREIQPSEYCGDDICQSDEDYITCKHDCEQPPEPPEPTPPSPTPPAPQTPLIGYMVIALVILLFISAIFIMRR